MSDPMTHYRHTIRRMDYDYSLEGAYFVTIVTYQRACLFGNIGNGKTELNPSGEIAFEQWVQLGHRFPQSDFSSFVIMPNHVHGIVVMVKGSGEKTKFNQYQMSTKQPNNNSKATPCLLGTVVRAYKASVTYRINAMRGSTKPPVWQRNYFEKIIRNQWENENIWKYIIANPDRWEEDQLHT